MIYVSLSLSLSLSVLSLHFRPIPIYVGVDAFSWSRFGPSLPLMTSSGSGQASAMATVPHTADGMIKVAPSNSGPHLQCPSQSRAARLLCGSDCNVVPHAEDGAKRSTFISGGIRRQKERQAEEAAAVADGRSIYYTSERQDEAAPAVADGRRCSDMESITAQGPTHSPSEACSGAHSPRSVAGDSDTDDQGNAVDALAFTPRVQFHGVKSSILRERNFEEGNIGIFFGNWGERAADHTKNSKSRHQQQIQDLQILKNPAQVCILCEANRAVAELLEQSPEPGLLDAVGLEPRTTHEHWVVRGNEKSAVLIAARKSVTKSLEMLEYEVNPDHPYTKSGKQHTARSKMLTCKMTFKQSVGHIGHELVVCGVHGHCYTMKVQWPQIWKAFWDRLVAKIRKFGIKFLAGDFNMSLTDVTVQLRSRGVEVDCVAWYPWIHEAKSLNNQRLGMDSCGIFYIGGDMQSSLWWGTPYLAADADTFPQVEQCIPPTHMLDAYTDATFPGQHWSAYRSRGVAMNHKSPARDGLDQRLTDLLTPSTTQAQLEHLRSAGMHCPCPYLRTKQKKMDIQYWLVGGDVHMGAHYPLCVFTNNARSRTNEAVEARRKRKPDKQFWWRHPHNPRSWSGPESAAAAFVTAVRSHEWTPPQRHV